MRLRTPRQGFQWLLWTVVFWAFRTFSAVVFPSVLFVSTSPKLLVTDECCYVVIITYIRVNRMARRLKGTTGRYSGGRSVISRGRCGGGLLDLRDIFLWPHYAYVLIPLRRNMCSWLRTISSSSTMGRFFYIWVVANKKYVLIFSL
jgi:hypothetical protein